MRDATSGRGRRAVAALLRILVSALVIVPVSAWSALALWFRLPAPEGARALAAGLFAVLGLATIAALFLRRSLIALTVFALVFGGAARLVEHDQAAARRRLGSGRGPADNRRGRAATF